MLHVHMSLKLSIGLVAGTHFVRALELIAFCTLCALCFFVCYSFAASRNFAMLSEFFNFCL